jgi:hypothetical protein
MILKTFWREAFEMAGLARESNIPGVCVLKCPGYSQKPEQLYYFTGTPFVASDKRHWATARSN